MLLIVITEREHVVPIFEVFIMICFHKFRTTNQSSSVQTDGGSAPAEVYDLQTHALERSLKYQISITWALYYYCINYSFNFDCGIACVFV